MLPTGQVRLLASVPMTEWRRSASPRGRFAQSHQAFPRERLMLPPGLRCSTASSYCLVAAATR